MSGLALHTDGLVIQLANKFVSISVSRQGTSWAGSWRPYVGAISHFQDAAGLSLSRAPAAAPLPRRAPQRAAQPRVLSGVEPRKSHLPILLCSTGTRTASFRRHTSDCCWTPSTATSSTLSAGACLPGRCVWQLLSPSSTFAPACLQRSACGTCMVCIAHALLGGTSAAVNACAALRLCAQTAARGTCASES